VCGDDIMAAPPYPGPVAVQEAVPLAMGASRPPAEGAPKVAKVTATGERAPAPEKDEDEDEGEGDEGAAWDTVSLYEEILDEVEAFEYSANGE
jgi:NAD-dependent histone deacetylase SIR2